MRVIRFSCSISSSRIGLPNTLSTGTSKTLDLFCVQVNGQNAVQRRRWTEISNHFRGNRHEQEQHDGPREHNRSRG